MTFSKISKNYLSGFFLSDLVASIPYNIFILTVGSLDKQTTESLGALKTLKVLRTLRVFRLFKTLRRVLNRQRAHLQQSIQFKKAFQTMDYIKSIIVLACHQNEKITTTNSKTIPIYYPTDIISSAIPRFSNSFLRGLIAVHHNDQPGVKEQLIQMLEDGFLKLPESVVRGLTSLATGEVDSIEDVATALKFDPDVAEGLAFVASSVTIDVDHKALNSSSSLNKLCDKLGLEHCVIAALLAIVNQDYEAGLEINLGLTLVDINDEFLSAIMAVYSDDIDVTPGIKTDVVEEYIAPISRLYCSGLNPMIAASLIRLVQGDVCTIQHGIGDKLGWSKSERNIVAALVLVSQRSFGEKKTFMQKKTLDFRPSEGQDWVQVGLIYFFDPNTLLLNTD